MLVAPPPEAKISLFLPPVGDSSPYWDAFSLAYAAAFCLSGVLTRVIRPGLYFDNEWAWVEPYTQLPLSPQHVHVVAGWKDWEDRLSYDAMANYAITSGDPHPPKIEDLKGYRGVFTTTNREAKELNLPILRPHYAHVWAVFGVLNGPVS